VSDPSTSTERAASASGVQFLATFATVLRRDRRLAVLVGAALLLVSPYLGLLAGNLPSSNYRNVWIFVGLASIVAAGCFADMRRLTSSGEARFRALVGAAFLLWVANEAGSYAFLERRRPLALAAQDVTFVVFTVLLAFAALAAAPAEERREERLLRSLHRLEIGVLIGGLFVYLILLPAQLDPEFANSSVPSASLNVTLDLLLLGLYSWRLRRTRSEDETWRWWLMCGAAALFAISDVFYLLWALGRFDFDRWPLLDLVWYVPHVVVLFAVRGPTALGRASSIAQRGDQGGETATFLRFAPSFLYAGLVPALHLTLEIAAPNSMVALPAQRGFALLLTVVLLSLGVAHQRRLASLIDSLRQELETGRRRRLSAERLEAIGRLTAGIAHDFNNLLTVILGRADLLRHRAKSPRVQSSIDGVLERSERAAELTSELLAVGQRETTLRERLVLDSFLAARRQDLENVVGERVRLNFELAADGEEVEVDPRHLERILSGLAANARAAMPNGGDLLVRTRRRSSAGGVTRQQDEVAAAEYLSIEIADTGEGLSPDVLERLFEPFFSTRSDGRGSGLGLAIVRGLVRQNDGQIVVRSRVGAGASFELLFPPAGGR